ncbi:MAG: hypothetical protein LBH31_01060 [Burkholderiaceae bacterium]|nr:hypothetical protein [Burkholderiaceae bacterium]
MSITGLLAGLGFSLTFTDGTARGIAGRAVIGGGVKASAGAGTVRLIIVIWITETAGADAISAARRINPICKAHSAATCNAKAAATTAAQRKTRLRCEMIVMRLIVCVSRLCDAKTKRHVFPAKRKNKWLTRLWVSLSVSFR